MSYSFFLVLLPFFSPAVLCCFPVIPDDDSPMIQCPPLTAYTSTGGANPVEYWFFTIGPAIISTNGASCPAGEALFGKNIDNDFVLIYATTCDTKTGLWFFDHGDEKDIDNRVLSFACGEPVCPLPTPCAVGTDPIIRVEGTADNRMMVRCGYQISHTLRLCGRLASAMSHERSWAGTTTICFYIREGYYGSALAEAERRLAESKEPATAVLRGLAMVLVGRRPEGMRILESLVQGEAALGAMNAVRVAQGRAAKPDKDSIRQLEADIAKGQRDATPEGLYSAAEVLHLTGQSSRAKALIDKALEGKPEDPKFLALLGWIEFTLGKDQKHAQKMLEKAAGAGYPDGYLGRVAILSARHAASEMRIVAREVSSSNVRLVPAHVVAVKAAISERDWEAAGSTLANALLVQEDSVYLLYLQAVHCIIYNSQNIERSLSELSNAYDSYEKGNDALAFSFASFFHRIALKNAFVAQFARKMLERALAVNPSKEEYSVLAFRIVVGAGDEKEANDTAKRLVQSDSEDPMARMSMVLAYLLGSRFRDASSQLGFIRDAHPASAKAPLFLFLEGVVGRHLGGPNAFDKLLAGCRNAAAEQFALLQGIPFGLEAIQTLDVDFLIGIVYQLLDYAPVTPTKGNDPALREIERILSTVYDHCPGLAEVCYLLARVKWLLCEDDKANRLVELLLSSSEATAEGFLLKAQMKVNKGSIEDAEAALDTGLSFSFAVRESPLFHLIKARVLKRRNDHERAVEGLRQALSTPEKEAGKNLLSRKGKDDGHRISLYLELIDSLQKLRRNDEAEKMMTEAMNKWKGKQQEEQLILMDAQLHVAKGDADRALAILSKVKPDQANYSSARTKMAEIYLEEKKDKRMFTVMYKELLDKEATPTTYALLGDAYMSVQNPKQAIEVYEKALKSNPKDHALAEKIGEAYVQCHLYNKAVNYYEAAVKSGRESTMRMKLANLLFQMENFDKCERILMEPLDRDPSPNELTAMQSHVQFWLLLSRVHHEKGAFEKANEDLAKAKSMQQRVISKVDGAVAIAMRRECAKICCQIADMHIMKRDVNRAADALKEAIQLNETDVKTHLALARVYLSSNKLEACNKTAQFVLGIDKNNVEASMMIADIMYTKNDSDAAYRLFTSVLDQTPNNHHALARYIELSWRRGAMEDAETRLRLAHESNPRSFVDAGLNYCRGLHECSICWYSSEINAALQAFNRAKRDLEWGERAIYNIVEICLNPDNEIVGDERGVDDPYEKANTKTAERFLSEIQFKGNGADSKYTLHKLMIQMASAEKAKVQDALEQFLNMAIDNSPQAAESVRNVGATLGAARAYCALKQQPKAKQLLKRVMQHQWSLEEADNLEKCWLMLGEMYTNMSKNEQASTMINKVLQHNQSCIKAYEMLGFIHEKEGKWNDASANYEDAWRYCKKRNPVIGYKLAYNYLKSRKYFDCIEVCQKVLLQYPQYPKIKKDVMDKARASIRA